MGLNRAWTEEEDVYLEEHWGSKSIPTLAKNLGRSRNAVMVRKTRLGLGRFLDSGDYITYSQFLQAIYGIDNASSAYREPKIEKGFPIRKKKRGSISYRVIYLDDFWEWAEENKRLIDFSKMEENILGAEPDWVKRKRRIDFECRVRTDPWTMADDGKLKRMLSKYRYSYTEIAAELNRTEGAIKRRICTLGLKERPMRAESRPWTDEEIQTLVFMYEEGWSFEKIGAELKRSALACRGRMKRIEHPEYTLRNYRDRVAKQTKE